MRPRAHTSPLAATLLLAFCIGCVPEGESVELAREEQASACFEAPSNAELAVYFPDCQEVCPSSSLVEPRAYDDEIIVELSAFVTTPSHYGDLACPEDPTRDQVAADFPLGEGTITVETHVFCDGDRKMASSAELDARSVFPSSETSLGEFYIDANAHCTVKWHFQSASGPGVTQTVELDGDDLRAGEKAVVTMGLSPCDPYAWISFHAIESSPAVGTHVARLGELYGAYLGIGADWGMTQRFCELEGGDALEIGAADPEDEGCPISYTRLCVPEGRTRAGFFRDVVAAWPGCVARYPSCSGG